MSDIGWNHIILEGFCMRKTALEKGKYIYKLTTEPNFKTKKILNPFYNPNYKTPRKPSYCKNKICFECFDHWCPHLGIGKPPKDDYEKIMKATDDVLTD